MADSKENYKWNLESEELTNLQGNVQWLKPYSSLVDSHCI